MPSLVKKWQNIQKELDEEEKSSSSDEDRDQLNSRRIEEWKQQQLLTYALFLLLLLLLLLHLPLENPGFVESSFITFMWKLSTMERDLDSHLNLAMNLSVPSFMFDFYISFFRGKAEKNANFEALPDDWRERLLKKRKLMQS